MKQNKKKNHKSETRWRNKTTVYEILNVGHELLISYNRRYVRFYLGEGEEGKSRLQLEYQKLHAISIDIDTPTDSDDCDSRNVFAPFDTSRFDLIRNIFLGVVDRLRK